MIVLVGASGSGKTSVAKELEKRGYKRIVTCTSRPKRDGEEDGVDYYFLSDDYFDTIADSFAEYSTYRGWKYGCYISTKDLDNKDSVVILTPKGMRKLKQLYPLYPKDIFTVYLDVDRSSRLIKMIQRGDDIEEAYRRSLSDVGMFDGVEDEVDLRIPNLEYSLSITEVSDIIERYYDYGD